MSIKRILIILVAVFFLQSCGFKFWYNRLDWAVSWRADDYVELTNQQEDELEALVREKLKWHRRTQLSRYVVLISELESDLGTAAIEQKYDYYQDNFIDFYQSVTQKITPELVELIAKLDDDQIKQLIKNINDNANVRLQEFNKSKPGKRLMKVKENIEDGFAEWTGRLTKSQKGLVSQWVDEMQPTAELRFAYGNQWRVAMEYALVDRASPEGKAAIKSLILNPTDLQSPELKSRTDANQELEKQYILMLHETMTKKQKKRFLRKLKSYREDFQDLINDE